MASDEMINAERSSFAALLAIFLEIKLQNDMNYYELCYRNGKMTKDESMKAISNAKKVAQDDENTIFRTIFNMVMGETKKNEAEN